MALSVSTQVNPIGTKLIVQTSATATSNDNVTGAVSTVYMVEVDNSANGAQVNYVKLYDSAAVTVGTTAPNMILMITAGAKRSYAFPEGILFATALSFACVTGPGTAGTADPGAAVIVRILAS